ncbi:hypothetical protein RSAG8_13596, partial [Rhizoctonia solani AG-8 WAC10335]
MPYVRADLPQLPDSDYLLCRLFGQHRGQNSFLARHYYLIVTSNRVVFICRPNTNAYGSKWLNAVIDH